MKTIQTQFSKSNYILKILFVLLLVGFIYSCNKENIEDLDYEFQIFDSYFYPDSKIRAYFNVLPKGGIEPYSIKWHNPDYETSDSMYSICTDSTQVFDFEITDAAIGSKRFYFNFSVDSIRAIAKDYRYQYVGTFECLINSSVEGTTKIISDTLKVTITNHGFYHINIHSHGGFWGMRYNYGDSFYGYHAGVSFKGDSIFYTRSGPMGAYYTNVYKGRKISETVIF